MEATIAGHLLAEDERWRRLAPAVEHLDLALTRLLGTLAERYLDEGATAALESPSPGEEDCRDVKAVGDDVRGGLKDSGLADHNERAVIPAFRCRTALTRLDQITRSSETILPRPCGLNQLREREVNAGSVGKRVEEPLSGVAFGARG